VADELTSPEQVIAAMVLPENRRNPYPFYDALRAFGNLIHVKPGLTVAVGYEECTRVLRDPRLRVQDEHSFDLAFPDWRSHSSLRGFTNSMLYRNPPDHTRMRALVSGAFTPRRLREVQPIIEDITDRLLDQTAELGADGTPVDLMAEFAFRLPVGVISELLGVSPRDQDWFRAMAAEVMIALEGVTNDQLQRANAAMDGLNTYLADLIAHCRRNPGDDLLTALVQVRDADGGGIGQDELLGNLVLLLTAGFDTTTHLLGHCVLQAIEEPDFAERLRVDEDFVPGYVEETLRHEPPVQATSRWADRDVDLLGTTIPADTKVLAIMAAGNRDPRRYPDPHRFDPDRKDVQPLSFAAGIHFCIGAPLARLETRIALPRLLRRFPKLDLAGTPTYRDRWLVRGHDHFPVRIGPEASDLYHGTKNASQERRHR